MPKYTVNVSVVYDDNTSIATVSSKLCEEDTFRVRNDETTDRRFCTYKFVEDRIYNEFKAVGYEFPRDLIKLSGDVAHEFDYGTYDAVSDDMIFSSMCFDVPSEEYCSFTRRIFSFIAEKSDE